MKKNLGKLLYLSLVFSLMVHMFMPLTVLADTTIVLKFTVEDNTKYALQEGQGGGIQVNKLSGGNGFIELVSGGANITNEATYNCTSQVECTATVTNRANVGIRFPGNFMDITSGSTLVVPEETVFAANTDLSIKVPANNNNDPVQPGPDGPQFDGKAYVIWSCESGGICLYHFDNIPSFDDGESKFYAADSIVDDRTHETFNVKAQYKAWSTDAKFENWVNAYKAYKNITGNIDWSQVNPNDMIGLPVDVRPYEEEAESKGACTKEGNTREEFEDCVNQFAATQKNVFVARAQLQPVGEPEYPNAYVSYGDRNFKTVIYNEEYRGVSIGSIDDLNYYPAEWTNPYIKRDQYDISGTTKDKPTGIDTILLEKTVNIKLMDYNGFEITKLEALDVPTKAVNIQKVDDEWRLTFASNFYDKVVFKATDREGKEYYFMIKRTTIDGWIKNVDNKPVLNADFYFDNRNNYSDFELSAKIVFKNGTEKNVKLEAVKGIDDGMGNITDVYEVDEEHPADPSVPRGKGLKKACFQYNLTEDEARNIKKIYLNAEFKGSTDTNYAGAYTGSGEGVLANIYTGEE